MQKKPPNKRAVYGILAFFLFGGLGFLTGAAWTYIDEHSGAHAEAKVLHCEDVGSGKGGSTYCTARWTVAGRSVTGSLENGKRSYVGKTVSVRVHGDRATKPTLWVSIGLAVMGLAVLAVAVWLMTIFRRQLAQPT